MCKLRRYFVTGILAFSVSVAHAGIVVGGTRVIYPEHKKEVTVTLKNKGSQAALVQSWIDTGDPLALPEKIHVPFVLTPPITRIDGGKGQTLRLIYTGRRQPKDRESVFWLNVLAIPPKISPETAQDAHYLNIAFQTRIKLFYRPEGLVGSAENAPSRLQWRKDKNELITHNPTPYYVSLDGLTLSLSNEKYNIAGKMIAPFSEAAFAVEQNINANDVQEIIYTAINDNGHQEEFLFVFK